MQRFIIISLLVVCCVFSVYAQKAPFQIADLYRLKGVADPQFSPDGKQIAFVVSESFLKTGKTNADVYVMNSDGSGIRNLTNAPGADNHPRWSPDGSKLLFVSTRSNGQQAWIMNPDGSNPTQLTDLSVGVGDPEWLPDGKHLAFSADIFPDCGTDDNCNKLTDSTQSGGPLQAHVADHLMYRHWTSWKDGKRTHTFVIDTETKKVTDCTPGDYDAPAFELGGTGFALSPDGSELCVVSNHDANEAETTNKDLFVVPTTGGEPKNITTANTAYDGNPQYSPDGRYIAYLFQSTPAYESDLIRLGLYDRKSGERTILSGDFDNWIGDIRWAPDSKSIFFTAPVKGHVPLFRVDVKSHKIKLVIDAKSIDTYSLSSDGKSIAFTRRAIGEPVELWKVKSDGSGLTRLSFFNKELADQVDIRPAEEIWVHSPSGSMIHTFVVKPHDFDPSKKYPVIVNVHGGPQQQWADAFRGDWQVYPGSGYIVAFCNPHGSTGYGQEFCAEISKDWNGKVYDDVMAVADSLATIPWVDKDRMGAMGWSYGGYFMMWLEGHNPGRFKVIASMMGVYDLTAMHGATEELWFPQWDLNGHPWDSPLYQSLSPSNYVKNFKTPCLVITGEKDYRVPYTQSLEFFTDLQEMHVPSRLVVFPNDGHWPNAVKSMPLYYNAHLDWFHTYLGGAPAPYDITKMLRNQAY
jgi:dipeptidyl aminopeptidase/acylaminoacyl peptidase